MVFIGNQPTAVPLTSSQLVDGIITTGKIADGAVENVDVNSTAAIAYSKLNLATSIVNGDIANATINLTQKVTGTLPFANGGTGVSTLGTANQVLAVNSSATALEFQSVSSDYVLLATTDASSSASVSFDGYFSSTYKNYKVIISNAIPANNNVLLRIRFRRSNADITTANYRGIVNGAYSNTGGTTPAANWYYNATAMSDTLTGSLNNTTIWGGLMMEMNLYNPLNTNNYKYVTYQTGYINYDATQWYTENGTGFLTDNASALSGITFFMNTGNIASGNFKLYGIK